ncbi:hypothetical protein AB6A40_003773 [Gnathostoma spinigerum]|uniref:RING-type domain-containing protein n=1 Tax=Gnathostoma spinigerum TaxID=75299 RepID=A0ABD6EG19_9BILA
MAPLGQCNICYSNFSSRTASALQCGHTYHYKCIKEWIKRSGNSGRGLCPQCRAVIKKDQVVRRLYFSTPNNSPEHSEAPSSPEPLSTRSSTPDNGSIYDSERASDSTFVLISVSNNVNTDQISTTHPNLETSVTLRNNTVFTERENIVIPSIPTPESSTSTDDSSVEYDSDLSSDSSDSDHGSSENAFSTSSDGETSLFEVETSDNENDGTWRETDEMEDEDDVELDHDSRGNGYSDETEDFEAEGNERNESDTTYEEPSSENSRSSASNIMSVGDSSEAAELFSSTSVSSWESDDDADNNQSTFRRKRRPVQESRESDRLGTNVVRRDTRNGRKRARHDPDCSCANRGAGNRYPLRSLFKR